MIDVKKIIKTTECFRIFSADKVRGRLSHAYLLLTPDPIYLREYLKAFAEEIFCTEEAANGFCGKCRQCKLIGKENFTDVKIYPEKVGGKISADDITALIEDSSLKPYEADKKAYIITDVSLMTAAAQNKLLKTLEEPPEGVYILLGATSEYSVLPTVRSRVNTLTLPPFTEEALLDALKATCPDETRLKTACINCDGTVGDAEKLYGDDEFYKVVTLAENTVLNLKNSKDVLSIANSAVNSADINEYLSALSVIYRDMAAYLSGGKPFSDRDYKKFTEGYNLASVIYASDKITEAIKRKYFNNNETMLIERTLLSILEGRYIWKKS